MPGRSFKVRKKNNTWLLKNKLRFIVKFGEEEVVNDWIRRKTIPEFQQRHT
jgi:hypothetical protein